MNEQPQSGKRRYIAHGTERMRELDGEELAGFGQRAVAFAIDAAITLALEGLAIGLFSLVLWYQQTGGKMTRPYLVHFDAHSWYGRLVVETLVPILYFGLLTWRRNGQTVGKRLMRIRVASLLHEQISLWHSIERTLGYAASALELGFGFLQFFIHPNRRTVHDRIAETIVIRERAREALAEGK